MELNIDGLTVQAREKQTVLEVARENGIKILSLCYHPKTGPAAKCSLCLVTVEGKPGLITACTMEAADGMNVLTDTKEIRQAQREIVDLMLSSGHHNCLTCDACGDCELQDAAYYLGVDQPTYQLPLKKEIDDSAQFILNYGDKCINCGLCVAGCNQTVVNEVLSFGFRGIDTSVIFDNDKPVAESRCVQCGECVQLCPVGALLDKPSCGLGRDWETEKVDSICPYCGVGCKVRLHINTQSGRVVRISGVEENSVNRGMLCVKGRYGYDFISDPHRLTTPLIKNNSGQFESVEWEQAITFISDKLDRIKSENGSDAIAGLASAKVTNEENYLFQKFFRQQVGTNNIDHCARL